jgi:hypothetical protein
MLFSIVQEVVLIKTHLFFRGSIYIHYGSYYYETAQLSD